LPVTLETVERDELERLVERLTTRAERTIELARVDSGADDGATDVRESANQPPVIRYVNCSCATPTTRARATSSRATRSGLAARFRVDGVLVPAPEPPIICITR